MDSNLDSRPPSTSGLSYKDYWSGLIAFTELVLLIPNQFQKSGPGYKQGYRLAHNYCVMRVCDNSSEILCGCGWLVCEEALGRTKKWMSELVTLSGNISIATTVNCNLPSPVLTRSPPCRSGMRRNSRSWCNFDPHTHRHTVWQPREPKEKLSLSSMHAVSRNSRSWYAEHDSTKFSISTHTHKRRVWQPGELKSLSLLHAVLEWTETQEAGVCKLNRGNLSVHPSPTPHPPTPHTQRHRQCDRQENRKKSSQDKQKLKKLSLV